MVVTEVSRKLDRLHEVMGPRVGDFRPGSSRPPSTASGMNPEKS